MSQDPTTEQQLFNNDSVLYIVSNSTDASEIDAEIVDAMKYFSQLPVENEKKSNSSQYL